MTQTRHKALSGTLSPLLVVILFLFSQSSSAADASFAAHHGSTHQGVVNNEASQHKRYAKRKQLPDGSWPAQHGKPPAPIPPHVHHSFNVSYDSGYVVPSENGLTPFGSSLRTVVLAGLQIAGMCSRTSDDWRGLLPRFIARKLEGQAEILLWDAKYSMRRSSEAVKDCKFCRPGGKRKGESFNCAQWFEEEGRKRSHAAELVVVLGSGKKDEHLTAMYEQPWVSTETTRFIHIPISHNERILENRVADFDMVLRDEEWVKPMHVDQINEFREACKKLSSRSGSFVWVARYLDWKGQTAFLKSIDPKLLKGHHIHFFTSKDSDKEGTLYYDKRREIERIAAERGIAVTVEPGRMEKQAMLSALCRAQGAIHFSLSDANPRAVYDEILSGLPIFLSRQSRVPEVVHQQGFVVTGDSDGGPDLLNEGFSEFLSLVEGRGELGLDEKFGRFVNEEMSEEAALEAMCCYMKICDCGAALRHRHEE